MIFVICILGSMALNITSVEETFQNMKETFKDLEIVALYFN